MVAVQRRPSNTRTWKTYLPVGALILLILTLIPRLLGTQEASSISKIQTNSKVAATRKEVFVEVLKEGNGPEVTKAHEYNSMVTLYIETADKPRTPSGWSTRKEDGATKDQPFQFQPGINLIEGWTEGVLKMKEGERALLHVPAAKGYGGKAMGSKGGPFFIPANSDLLFDIEILGKVSKPAKVGNVQKLTKQCPYNSLSDLTTEELHPAKGPRHMVDPPAGGNIHLICCHTTKGPLNALIHEKWAPLGAGRVLEMVKTGYFNAGVPLMRCLKNFLCQFGLNNDPSLSKNFRKNLVDDPNWLPEGPTHRKNEDGVERFAHGYMAYAGGGKNSRTNQLIVSLKDVETLAGGSPWEVPWGELVGPHSFETLSKFYYGYGEKGPPQGKLWNKGMTEEMKQEFPNLDYITECAIVDEQIES